MPKHTPMDMLIFQIALFASKHQQDTGNRVMAVDFEIDSAGEINLVLRFYPT